MISTNDLILLLTNLQEDGIDVKEQLKGVIKGNDPLQIIQFINQYRELNASKFYTHIRKSYNQKRSQLYKNIVNEDITEAKDILTTLASLNLQILLFCNKLDEREKPMFLQHMRFSDINRALYQYGKTFDLSLCAKLLKYIRTDLKAFESIK